MTPDSTSTTSGHNPSGLVIPEELKAQHGPLLQLIVESESMNNEERQYWINILPIMTPEQVENLRGILTNEKQQLAAIDRKYNKEVEQIGQQELLKETETRRRERREELHASEAQFEEKDEEHTEDILKEIEGF